MIKWRLTHDGAFVVGDTVTGLTVYSYPSSPNATDARRIPERVARDAIKSATPFANLDRADYDRRNWALIDGTSHEFTHKRGDGIERTGECA